MNTSKRKKELIQFLNLAVDDLQMLAINDTDYEAAFKDAVALLTYVEAINSVPPTSAPQAASHLVQ